MPIKSFLTRTSPSRWAGTGKSILYCKTSGLPKFSIWTPFIVLGIKTEVIVVCNRNCDNCIEDRRVELKSGMIEIRITCLANMCCYDPFWVMGLEVIINGNPSLIDVWSGKEHITNSALREPWDRDNVVRVGKRG